jgi:hypothetical protein
MSQIRRFTHSLPILLSLAALQACSSREDSGAANTASAGPSASAETSAVPSMTPDDIRALAMRMNDLAQKPRLQHEIGWTITSRQGTGADANADQYLAQYSEGGDCFSDWSVVRRNGEPVLFTHYSGCAVESYPREFQDDSIFLDKGKAIGGTSSTITVMGEDQPNKVKSKPLTDAAAVKRALRIATGLVALDTALLNKAAFE